MCLMRKEDLASTEIELMEPNNALETHSSQEWLGNWLGQVLKP